MRTYRIKRRLKGWVKVALAFIAGVLFTIAVQSLSERSERWYQDCDNHYGYVTSYYTCGSYHRKGGDE